ncbi:MAG: serine/threonine-protein kinase, partial [Thermoanaerobaculia bacterium]
MSLVPGTLFSRFQIVSPLGSGGMGEVYQAWDPSLKRHVALKILSPETIGSEERRGRLTREARAASALNHPNIVTVYEIGQALVDQSPVDFIAMELIEGETLRSLLTRGVDMTKALHYLAQTADGLAKAHAAGILHRDLKPANIMVTPDGFAKILDFGLARNSGLENDDDPAGAAVVDTITRPGAMMGTVGYMSPEQVRGLPLDQRSDIFSFGCILYEVLTLRRPFQGSSQVDTLHKTVYEPPPQIGDVDPPVPDALRRVALKCLAKDPEARYQSAKEIAIDLREIKRDYESNLHSSNALFPRTPAGPGMRRGLWLIVALTVLIAATGVWLWSQRNQSQSHSRTGSLQSMRIERLPATSRVRAVAISPDGRYIAHVESTPGGDVLMVRQVTTGSEIEAAPAVGKNYEELSFSPDGEYIRYVHDGA